METNRGKGVMRTIMVSLLGVAMGFFFFFSCETENLLVNLALKKQGKTYVFSKLGSFITKTTLDNNESPSVFPFVQIFNDDGLFVSPDHIEEIVNTVGGNYELFPFEEKSYDGYFTAPKNSLYSSNNVNRSTEVVGEQIRETTITLNKLEGTQVYEIVYEYNPASGEYKAIKNCKEKSFWITRSIQPGETTTSSEDFIMVNLNEIVTFYDSNLELKLNTEEQLLYIIAN